MPNGTDCRSEHHQGTKTDEHDRAEPQMAAQRPSSVGRNAPAVSDCGAGGGPVRGVTGGCVAVRGPARRRRRRAAVHADPVGEVAHGVRRDRRHVGRDRRLGVDETVAVDRAGHRRRPSASAVATMRLMTSAASRSGCAARTSATRPGHDAASRRSCRPRCTYPPPGTTPTSCSLGAATAIVMPWHDASKLASSVAVDAGDGRARPGWSRARRPRSCRSPGCRRPRRRRRRGRRRRGRRRPSSAASRGCCG